MRSLTQEKTSYYDMSYRQNPEFKETAIKYINKKKERKELDHRKHLVTNQVKHYQKLNQELSKTLEQKEHELQWLKQVRQRYLTSINEKKYRQEEEKQKLEELRLYNTTIRQKSIENINDALNQLHKKKAKAHDEVNRTMKELKDIYHRKKSITDANNHSLFLEVKRSRVKGKNRVNKFFQKKSTELTKYYKSAAEEEEQKFISGVREIEQLHERESTFKRKINKKEAKMSKILNQIEELKRSSHEIALCQIRSDRYDESCRITKNRSKISRTNRTENLSDDRNSIGFKLTNVGSTQFIDQEEEIK